MTNRFVPQNGKLDAMAKTTAKRLEREIAEVLAKPSTRGSSGSAKAGRSGYENGQRVTVLDYLGHEIGTGRVRSGDNYPESNEHFTWVTMTRDGETVTEEHPTRRVIYTAAKSASRRSHSTKNLKLSKNQKTMLRMARDTGRMSSGRYGWNEMHVRALEKKGLVTLVSKATWDKEWKLTDLGRETAKALHAEWLSEWGNG